MFLEQQTEGSPSEDPKTLARTLIREGVDPAEIAERTGLSQSSVNGLKGVLRKTIKKAQGELASPEDKAAGSGNVGEQEIIVDMKKEAQIASGAVTLARSQQRLRSLDSKAYQDLYGGQQSEVNSPSRVLVDLETARLIRNMRIEEQQGGHNNNGSNQVSELQRQMAELREQLHKKDLEILQKQSDKLEAQLVELRADLRSSAGSTSDLAVVIRESSQLLSQVITHPGPIRNYLAPDIVRDKKEAPLLAQPAEARNKIIDTLRMHGLTTRI